MHWLPKTHRGLTAAGSNGADAASFFVAIDSGGKRNAVRVRGRGKNRREDLVEGSRSTTCVVRDIAFSIPVTGFWQAHESAADYYAERIFTWLPKTPGGVGWDLYGGVGVLAAPLAELVGRDGRVISVEEFPGAAQAGSKAFASAPDTFAPVEFRTGDVTATVTSILAESPGIKPDLVVCDPPRSGAGAAAIEAIAQARPQHIFHLGCDPATFARDARYWADNGYNIQKIEVVDAFPGTHHMEVLALFKPSDSSRC